MVQDLIACGVQPTQAKQFAAPIESTLARFGIASVEQRAAFVAQCMHESASFTRLEESLWYNAPARIMTAFARLAGMPMEVLNGLCRNPQGLANAAYQNRNGNAGSLSNHGWMYRGSGIMQLTGLNNFARAQADTGRPYLAQPELVRTHPEDAVLTAGLFWDWNRCNAIMADGDFDGLSRQINLGNRRSTATPNGNQARRDLYAQALAVLRGRVTT